MARSGRYTLKGQQPDIPRLRVRRPHNWYSHIARRERSRRDQNDTAGVAVAVALSAIFALLILGAAVQQAFGF